MKFFKNTKLVLVLIILLASFLRLPLINSLPAGITVDEAGQAYSAYSILKTGKDEWGDFLPLNPRGFGDYKPPLFMYVLVPSVAVFGLNEFAVRIPSAIAGILTVLVVYFLVKELFKNKNLALLASFLTAIAPWHVYYSRLGWESNIGLLFFILGIWLFLKSLKKGHWIIFSVFFFGLGTLSYHSFKVLAPLMLVSLIFIFRKQIKFSIGNIFLASTVALIFILVLSYGFIFSGSGRRAQDQSLLKEENLNQVLQEQFNNKFPSPLNKIANNKYYFALSRFSDNYIGYFSPSFLFGPHRSEGSVLNFPTVGLFYIWQLPLLLLGIFYLIKNFSDPSKVLFVWILIAPIPASLTQDFGHAGRAQALFPALLIFSAVGLNFIYSLIKKRKYKFYFVCIAGITIAFSLFIRIDRYLFNTFNNQHGGLVKGYEEVIKYTLDHKDSYEKIIFTTSNSEPQAFIAFYTLWDPQDFQNHSKNWKKFESDGLRFLDMSEYSLGMFDFHKVDISRDRHNKNALIIGSKDEISPLYTPEFSVDDSTGKVLFIAIDSDEIPQ